MKIWGIIATILMIVFLGTSVWMYTQNKDLKSKNDTLNTELTTAKTAKDQVNAKMAAANKKVEVLTLFFSGDLNQEQSLKMYDLIKSMNNDTLMADWKTMQDSKQGDNSGNKMIQDLLTAMTNDLK